MDGGGPFCGRLGTLDVWSNLAVLFRSTACLVAFSAASSVAAGAKNDGVLGQEERRGCGKL